MLLPPPIIRIKRVGVGALAMHSSGLDIFFASHFFVVKKHSLCRGGEKNIFYLFKIIQIIQTYPNLSKLIQTYPNHPNFIQIYSNLSKLIQIIAYVILCIIIIYPNSPHHHPPPHLLSRSFFYILKKFFQKCWMRWRKWRKSDFFWYSKDKYDCTKA